MHSVKKDIRKKRRRHDYHLRMILVVLAFVLETLLFVGICFLSTIIVTFDEYLITFSAFLAIFNLILTLFIFNTRAQINYKMSWLAVIHIFPFFGGVIYILYAHKITTKRQKRKKFDPMNDFLSKNKGDSTELLEKLKTENSDAYNIAKFADNSHFDIYQNTKFNYFKLGEEGFEQILLDLKKAKKFIFIEFFIIEYGLMFNSIYEILLEKLKEGVEIRFIFDDFGCSTKVPSNFQKLLRNDGIDAYAFNRISPTMNIRQNARDHRKIIVIDGIIGYTGGCNLADEYINKVQRFGHWKDNFLRIEGEAVEGLTKIFLSMYQVVSKKFDEDISKFLYKANFKELGENRIKELASSKSYIQPIADKPFDKEDIHQSILLSMISRAKKSIYISTPYLIIDDALISALGNAARSGVDVNIITPGIPDKKMVYQATKSHYFSLLVKKVNIFEYTPGFNHEKAVVIDDDIALSGTCNLDYRSLFLHFEDTLLIINDNEIIKMKESLQKMCEVSKKQKTSDYGDNNNVFVRLYWSILKVFAPLL